MAESGPDYNFKWISSKFTFQKSPQFDEQVRKLERFNEIAGDVFREGMGDVVQVVSGQAQRNAPKRTGRLAGSLGGRVTGRTLSSITGRVASSIAELYPFLIEVGWKPRGGGARVKGKFYLYYAPRDKLDEIDKIWGKAGDKVVRNLEVV